jgi:hypothetical protein
MLTVGPRLKYTNSVRYIVEISLCVGVSLLQIAQEVRVSQ